MRPSSRNKISLFAATAAMAISAGLVGMPAASAAVKPVEITGFTVKDMVFSSSKCSAHTITARGKVATNVDSFYADAAITRNGVLLDVLELDESDESGRVVICPQEGLGAYKVGPTNIYDDADRPAFDYWDNTSKTFYVRGKATSAISSARQGKVVTLKVSASYYNPSVSKYSALNAKGVKVQRKTTRGWTTIKTVNLAKGKASFRYTQKAKASYRAVVAQTSRTTAATSATTKR